jgi:TM2 domain-containing membrane protein YozV
MGIYALLTFLFGATVGGIITCVLLIGAEWWLIFSRSGFDKLADVYFFFFAKKDPAQQAAAAAHVDASFAAQAPAEAELAAAAGL